MPYFALTDEDRRAMLAAIGAPSVRALFADVPQDALLEPRALKLPPAMREPEILRMFRAHAAENRAADRYACFLGAGCYWRHVPEAVRYLALRGEFLTAYTPYQPEISQGTLQAAFEFQTAIARLTAMEVANSSMYDAATSLAEAALMARRITRRDRIVFAGGVHPRWRQVAENYLKHSGGQVAVVPAESWATDAAAVAEAVDEATAAAVVQFPDAFGAVFDPAPVREACRMRGALMIIVVPDPVLCAWLAPPGEMGADIACGSAQGLGLPMSFGGPSLGFLATKMRFVRQMPGRICGMTKDANGRAGFVLTLSAREQHIRRGKATSNICSNQQLLALMATGYCAWLGARGLAAVAKASVAARRRLKAELPEALEAAAGPRAHETVIRFPSQEARERFLVEAKKREVLGGVRLERLILGADDAALLVATTEMITEEMIGRWIEAAKAVL
ncbi:MAG: aminomethyl-transferring glycine dehydrogenase subunit GcvPA [Zetaproteobacteria bacterium]|nr:MAG: aminomethyl-transferring glycine dehydrogenase subunit GcvPA [Zetaproteobacteria bacterium]